MRSALDLLFKVAPAVAQAGRGEDGWMDGGMGGWTDARGVSGADWDV